MTLTKSGGLQFSSPSEWKQRILLQLLQRATGGEGIRATPKSFTVKKGNFLAKSDPDGSLSVFFAYMIGKKTYGLYIVDFSGVLVMIPMRPGELTEQFLEVKWLVALQDEL